MNTPELLRKARKAVFRKHYSEAVKLYEQILASSAQIDNLDLQLRYAWCLDRSGQFDESRKVYQKVIDLYRAAGEEGVARTLEQTVANLHQRDGMLDRPEMQVGQQTTDSMPLPELMAELAAMGAERYLKPKELLCRAGDASHALWLLRKGTLEVRLPEYKETDVLRADKGAWVVVGEIGFYTGQRRKATVQAVNECRIVEIASQAILQRTKSDLSFARGLESLMREMYVAEVLARHQVFEKINDVDRRRLAHAFRKVACAPGHVLIEEGEEHDGAYMVLRGCLYFMHRSDEGDQSHLRTNSGHFVLSVFPGEIIHMGGLLPDYKSEFRVVAATNVELLHLSRKAFEPYAARRPWIIPAIIHFGRRPVHLHVMRPGDEYLWKADRKIHVQGVER